MIATMSGIRIDRVVVRSKNLHTWIISAEGLGAGYMLKLTRTHIIVVIIVCIAFVILMLWGPALSGS